MEKKIIQTSIRIPEELHKKITEEANKQHRSVHNMLLFILEEYFEKKD